MFNVFFTRAQIQRIIIKLSNNNYYFSKKEEFREKPIVLLVKISYY